jgi:hypothetical protein
MAITDADIKAEVCLKYGIDWDTDDYPEQDVTVYRAEDGVDSDVNLFDVFENFETLRIGSTMIGTIIEIAVIGAHTFKTGQDSNWTEWTGLGE